MIKPGDIVHQRRRGGIIKGTSNVIVNSVGLVIKEFKEKASVPQYYVQFDQKTPKWFYQHDLHKIDRKERK